MPRGDQKQETAEQLAAGVAALAQLRERIDGLVVRHDALPVPHPKSRLAGADALNPYDPPSYQAQGLIAVGTDFASSLNMFIQQTGALPLFAQYPMIRATLEAAATGLWMMDGGRREKIAWRSLQLAWSSAYYEQQLVDELPPALSVGRRRNSVPTRLLELQQGLGDYRGHELRGPPPITEVLRYVSRFQKLTSTDESALMVWRACSGIAHANRPVMNLLLEREPVGSGDNLGAQFKLTSSVALTAYFMLVAVEYLEMLVDRYETACADPTKAKT